MTAVRVLALVCLLVLAGCANPLGDGGETPTEMAPAPLTMNESTPDGESTETAAPDETVTPDDSGVLGGSNASGNLTFPPGVTSDGIDDADALFQNHTEALERTGFVAIGNGSSVVSERGLLIDVETDQRNSVAANGTPYEIRRDAVAGPIERSVHVWSNGSVEYVNRQEGGDSNYTAREPRPMAVLTGNRLLGPYVRGGDFDVQEHRNTSSGGTLVVLNATGIDNTTVLERAVTDDAEEITAYDAVVVIDDDGRIQVLDATIEYVINGQTAVQQFTYELTSIEGAEVSDPDWLDEARDATNETADATGDEEVASVARAG